jgi:hypothetical protein
MDMRDARMMRLIYEREYGLNQDTHPSLAEDEAQTPLLPNRPSPGTIVDLHGPRIQMLPEHIGGDSVMPETTCIVQFMQDHGIKKYFVEAAVEVIRKLHISICRTGEVLHFTGRYIIPDALVLTTWTYEGDMRKETFWKYLQEYGQRPIVPARNYLEKFQARMKEEAELRLFRLRLHKEKKKKGTENA